MFLQKPYLIKLDIHIKKYNITREYPIPDYILDAKAQCLYTGNPGGDPDGVFFITEA